MPADVWLLLLAVPALVVLPQLGRALGPRRGLRIGLGGLCLWGGGWGLLHWQSVSAPAAGPDHGSATSATCFKCHESHYASWHRSYHRTMTREATPEYVKGDFADATFTFQGVTSHLTRDGDAFFMTTAPPGWRPEAGPPRLQTFRVERLVGSHWFQECLGRDDAGRYWRLPLSYHIVEGRWIHTNGAFLAPDTDDFWSKSTVWNETCLFCHNTRPSKRPLPRRGGRPGYDTEVVELGIACEACHGPGEEHVRANHNPARRLSLHRQGAGDPTIVNPRRLPVERADHICAHCHGATVPRAAAWDWATMTDPFRAGDDLLQAFFFFWSEMQQAALYKDQRRSPETTRFPPPGEKPAPTDGRFWGDGTPLTTALEYTGMALSACYERGRGRLSCLSCHSLHEGSRTFQLAAGMDTNAACYQCHGEYRDRLVGHTHHAADSPGSLCYNCHMPYQVYSLLTGHRSHRIVSPRVRDSLGTGKPHACNLCHLDKSLAWTQDRLGEWYGQPAEPLPEVERTVASAVVHLSQSDARSRAVVAAAFSWPAAGQASGRDWAGPLLAHLLERERYPAVRYLAHRGLRALYGADAGPYDYLAAPAERTAQLRRLRARLEARCRPPAAAYPSLPLRPDGTLDEAKLEALLRARNDPDVIVNE
jgi:predicted CXXCH cytochrome family protein